MIAYIVCCDVAAGAEAVADRWLQWLREEHLAEVIACGAASATVIELDGSPRQFEIHYRFPDRDACDRYLQLHAPRLRAKGLRRFPLELGLSYRRKTGEVVHSTE